MPEPLLRVEGLSAGYDGAAVVRDLSFSVTAGEVVAMLGPNGAGKTTTLRVVSGVLPVGDGEVSVFGEPLRRRKPEILARAGLCHMPEGRSVFSGLSVAEHFRIGPAGHRPDAEMAYEYFPVLKDIRNRRAGLLSGGEQQMLALGRALALKPRLLLLDELSLGLAPVIVERLLPIVREYATSNGAGVLLVEQHVQLGLSIADRAIVMSHGEVIGRGEAAEMADDHELIVASYLGEREMDE